jgi:Alcohol dehydrogenase GroES-like domain
MQEALVLERKGELALRKIELPEKLGPHDVKIAIQTVGICGSDVHYYEYGKIGPFVVNAPMVLGHEAAGVVVEVGEQVKNLRKGDRVCMEPGIPDPNSRAARLGIYNLDPAVRFWATPPVHGCLTGTVIHPAGYTFKLPDNVSFAEGAMVEPLAVGMHAAVKAKIKPGDLAVVIGAGPIGMVTALAALAAGCSDCSHQYSQTESSSGDRPNDRWMGRRYRVRGLRAPVGCLQSSRAAVSRWTHHFHWYAGRTRAGRSSRVAGKGGIDRDHLPLRSCVSTRVGSDGFGKDQCEATD